MPDQRHHGGGDRRGGPLPRSSQPSRDEGSPKERIRRILASQDTVPGGYVEQGRLRELLDPEAQAAAKALAKTPMTQVRRFYGQVLAVKRRLDAATGQISDSEIKAQMAFLKAAAAYAAVREPAKGEPLLKFLMPHTNTISGVTDFQQFHRHFEAVVAFHRVYCEDK